MEQQHPIPQQISSYQFRLVGDMTLKQFFQVGGGVLFALLIYSTSLHPVIKWPIILLSTGLGAAMAFLPFEERPLEKWIFAFFRSIYTPTAYFWEKAKTQPVFFQEEAPTPTEKGVIAPHGEVVLEEYLNSTPEQKLHYARKLEDAEKNILARITCFTSGGANLVKQVVQTPPVPNTT